MSQSRWTIRAALGAAGLAAGTLVAGCGGGGGGTTPATAPTQASAPSSSTTTTQSSGSATPTTSTDKGTLEVPEQVATQLCDKIEPQLSDWRVQGPSLGKVALNISVHEWAAQNGGINLQVLGDKALVDRVTTAQCSDVRTEALKALELPDLASGIA